MIVFCVCNHSITFSLELIKSLLHITNSTLVLLSISLKSSNFRSHGGIQFINYLKYSILEYFAEKLFRINRVNKFF